MHVLERGASWARLEDERGITLVEVLIATAILGIVMLVFTSTLSSMQQAVVAEDVRTRLNDQARLALADLDRQVRSGNLLYDPDDEIGTVDPFDVTAAGFMFRVYTQTKFTATDEPRCATLVGRRSAAPALPLLASAGA